MSEMARRKRRKFTPEQKADAVRLVEQVGSLAQVARDLDLNESSLYRWVNQTQIDKDKGAEGPLKTDEREELRLLRQRVRTLELERDFAKKAAAFFARELDPPTR